ncbi:hypothetical protein pb186bvf_004847 [Paramecium bursaria]
MNAKKKVKLESMTTNTDIQQSLEIFPQEIDFEMTQIKNLLIYSPKHAYPIIERILLQDNANKFIVQVGKRNIELHKLSLIYLLQQTKDFNIGCQNAQSLDPDIRLAALKSLQNCPYQNEFKQLIEKCNQSLDLIGSNNRQGLLIQLLEDEYLAIRCAALQVIQTFSAQSSDFGSKVLNLYVMMLNDESDIVRIQAIKCLLSYKTIELEKNDCDALLFNINEINFKLRQYSYQLFGICHFTQKGILKDVLNTLAFNVQRYPEDFIMLSRALKNMAQLNQEQLSILEILNNPERFTTQADWDQPEYVLRMIYCYNSLQRSNDEPYYFNSHYDYLSDKYPTFFKNNNITPQKILFKNIFKEFQELLQQLRNNIYQKNKHFIIKRAIYLWNLLVGKFDFQSDFDISKVPLFQFENCENQEVPDSLLKRLGQFAEIRKCLELKDIEQYNYRQFSFIKPQMNIIFKLKQKKFIKIDILGEFKYLKQPIHKNYQFQAVNQCLRIQNYKISANDIDDNLIQIQIELSQLRLKQNLWINKGL